MVSRQSVCFLTLLGVISQLMGTALGEESHLKIWWTDYAAAYHLAEKEDKPLLVVFEKGESLGVSSLQAVTFNQSSVSRLLKPYVLCRIDASTEEGRDLARKFNAPGFPSVVITDKRLHRVIYRRHGILSELDWAVMLVSYRTGERPAEKKPIESKSRATICYT